MQPELWNDTMTAPSKSVTFKATAWRPWRLRRMLLPVALLLGALSACSMPHVSYPIPPANCSKRVPASLLKDVKGWPLPAGDAAQDWQAFGVGESGQRVQANERATTVLDIVTACKSREAEIYQALTKRKKVLGLF